MVRVVLLLLALCLAVSAFPPERQDEVARELERLLEEEDFKDEEARVAEGTALSLVGKTALQLNMGSGGVPSRAVDGNRDGNWRGSSCTHTVGGSMNPFWKVNLGELHCISKVTLYNRKDCCSSRLANFQIRVGEAGVVTQNAPCGAPVSPDEASSGGAVVRECGEPILGRYISVDRSGSATLTLCEVEAEEVPMEICVPDVNECEHNPCMNSAECVDGDNMFTCLCPDGFTGIVCENPPRTETEVIDELSVGQISAPEGMDTWTSASRVRDGDTDDLTLLDAHGNVKSDGSCTTTTLVANPWIGMHLSHEPQCISKVSILTPMDGKSGRSVDFTVDLQYKTGEDPEPAESHSCVTLMSAEEAALPGAEIVYHCSPPAFANSVTIKIKSDEPTLLQICEVRVWRFEHEDMCAREPDGEREMVLTGKHARQSSTKAGLGERAASKAIDGRIDDGSCTATVVEPGPLWYLVLVGDHCIKKVSILKGADGSGEGLAGVEVRVGRPTHSFMDATLCGSPVTPEQAADTSISAIDFECSQPVRSMYIFVYRPTDSTVLRLCEVKAWEVPIEECLPGPEGQLEMDIVNGIVSQSSGFGDYTAAELAPRAVDGRHDDADDISDIGSCTATGQEDNPWWKLDLGGTHCIGTVSVLSSISEQREVLLGATVAVETADGRVQCGSPVTGPQLDTAGNIYFTCYPPVQAETITITNPRSDGSLRFCDVRVFELPMDQCEKRNPLETELSLGGFINQQSSNLNTNTRADKAVDGRYDDAMMETNVNNPGGSCSSTKSEENPYWILGFDVPHCISRVSILNRADGHNDRLTGAVASGVTAPTDDSPPEWHTCGSPVTAEQAAVPGANIFLDCDPPIKAGYFKIEIMAPEAILQMCEVRIWELPFDECPLLGETELILTDMSLSLAQSTSPWESDLVDDEMAAKAVDGRYKDSNLLGEDGHMDSGSCAITESRENPFWAMSFETEHCISKVSILNRGDGQNERLEGAIVKIGTKHSVRLDDNTACGLPVTAEQAAEPGGTVTITCSQPIRGIIVVVGIPSEDAVLQLCEVRVWEVPMEQCPQEVDECVSDPCQNGGECVDGVNEFTCTCAAGFTGPLCETDIDECSSSPCQNGVCNDEVNGFTCECSPGYEGAMCDTNTDECNSSPCQNGVCHDEVNGFSCECSPGYEGALCDTNTDECGNSPCQNGVCHDEVNGFSCECSPGYEGTLCETNTDECGSSPCQNGLCHDEVNGFRCECSPGYEGTLCDTNTDECDSSPCQNGVCHDEVNGFSCECSPGYEGALCDTNTDECASSPCQNGVCHDEVNGFSCECSPGYEGTLCETNIDECSSSPCQNGVCHDKENSYNCECSTGYAGLQCEIDVNGCIDHPCQNGVCHDEVVGYSCECSPGYDGTLCENNIDECASSPCQHGRCHDEVNGYSCECSLGYEDTHCETNIDECGSNPCQNGVCHDEVNGFSCECSPGHEGALCDSNIDECASSPCQNGLCHDEVNGFSCECSPGYEGTLCDKNTDECGSSPCQNGVCHDKVNGFNCECSPGYEGALCDANTDECGSSPCQNGVCHDEVNGFSCECSPGYEGTLCETNTDECSSSPCQNGMCHDKENGYNCECSLGYAGLQCEIDIDECASSPCQNGMCHDEVNSFSCECSPGYEGALCDTNIDECSGTPCQNGVCHDEVNGFSCECSPGYEGTLCDTDTDECANSPCQNGVCHDEVNGFSCKCSPGYEGALCNTSTDECGSSPCQNGVCHDEVNSFSCECSPGYDGALCDINIDECVSEPCQNGAECVDGDNEVTCNCAPGFTGDICQTAVEPTSACESGPCQNGVCHDEEDGFRCECSPGYEGTLCATAIEESTECTINPCKNGICIHQGADGFKCICSPGFKGTACEIDIDECASDPCQNDGVCVDGVDEMTCQCAAGFAGHLCETAEQQESLQEKPITRPVGPNINFVQVNLANVYCIKKVVVHKRGYCSGLTKVVKADGDLACQSSWRGQDCMARGWHRYPTCKIKTPHRKKTRDMLAGSVVRAGTNPTWLNNGVCRQQVGDGSTVVFECNPPQTAQYVALDAPSLMSLAPLQLCDVTVEQSTLGPCY